MSTSVFWRLVWKEYRLQRAFWIAMAVLTVLLQLAVLAFIPPVDDRVSSLFAVALALPAFYALGSASILFATEHETGTYAFQRGLPVGPMWPLVAKSAFTVASTLAMIGVLWTLAAVLAGWEWPRAATHRGLWAVFGFGAVEGLAWGMLFSLVTGRPLKAAVLAAVTASVSVHFIVAGSGPQYQLRPYLDALPDRALVVAILALWDVWLGCRWFDERTRRSGAASAAGRVGHVPGEAQAVVPAGWHVPGGSFARLLWQQLRQSAGMLAVTAALVGPVVFIGASWWLRHQHLKNTYPSLGGFFFDVFQLAALSAAPLMGTCVFLGDQRGCGFRFLVERGVRPGWVWLSRQLVWLIPALVVGGLTLSVFVPWMRDFPETDTWIERLGVSLGLVTVGFACGQLASMFFRSGVLAGFLSLVLAGLLCVWAGLMRFLGVPWLCSVLPIPAVLFGATWLRSPHWMLERNTVKGWLRVGVSLVVPAVVVFGSVIAYRVYSIPAVDPGFSVEEYTRPAAPEARATADVYHRAMGLLVSFLEVRHSRTDLEPKGSEPGEPLTELERAWLAANEESLSLAMEASQRAECDFVHLRDADPRSRLVDLRSRLIGSSSYLGDLLVVGARQRECDGDLDAAWERYRAVLWFTAHLRRRSGVSDLAGWIEREVYPCLPFWAIHREQTADRIRAVIAELEMLAEASPIPHDPVKAEYLWARRFLASERPFSETMDKVTGCRIGWPTLAPLWLPWENARARRVLDLATARRIEWLDGIERAVADDADLTRAELVYDREEVEGLVDISPWLRRFVYRSVEFAAAEWVHLEARRRAARVQLALAGWQIEHGRLPEKLDELVGPYLNQMPLDPFTGKPFRYFPEGTGVDVYDIAGKNVIVSARQPYFCTAELDRAAWYDPYPVGARFFPIPARK
ncbi:MAG: hypothetical protein ACYTG0_18770 [Planctomycetota bacterium]|jgi:hypothetical protein